MQSNVSSCCFILFLSLPQKRLGACLTVSGIRCWGLFYWAVRPIIERRQLTDLLMSQSCRVRPVIHNHNHRRTTKTRRLADNCHNNSSKNSNKHLVTMAQHGDSEHSQVDSTCDLVSLLVALVICVCYKCHGNKLINIEMSFYIAHFLCRLL